MNPPKFFSDKFCKLNISNRIGFLVVKNLGG